MNITAISIGFSGRYISNPVVTMVMKHINQLMGTTARRIITNIIDSFITFWVLKDKNTLQANNIAMGSS